jgi:hypothetical protein
MCQKVLSTLLYSYLVKLSPLILIDIFLGIFLDVQKTVYKLVYMVLHNVTNLSVMDFDFWLSTISFSIFVVLHISIKPLYSKK